MDRKQAILRMHDTGDLSARVPPPKAAFPADGLAPKAPFAVGPDRAFHKPDAIKDNAILWQTRSRSQQRLIDGFAVIGMIDHERAYHVKKNKGTGGRFRAKRAKCGFQGPQRGEGPDQRNNGGRKPGESRKSDGVRTGDPTRLRVIDADIRPWLSASPQNKSKGILPTRPVGGIVSNCLPCVGMPGNRLSRKGASLNCGRA